MFFLLGGQDKKKRKPEPKRPENHERVRDLFMQGRFPVVTTDFMEGKNISKVLGLVCCRGYDSEEAFFGMAAMAVNKGAHAIVGYSENVAFHPDGSKYFSCFGTAVMFEWEQEEKYGAAALRIQMTPRSSESQPPRAQRAGASGGDHDFVAPRMGDMSSADSEQAVRRMAAAHVGASSERSGRLNARVDDDLDMPPVRPVPERAERAARPAPAGDDMGLPPLRPAGSSPSWHRQ